METKKDKKDQVFIGFVIIGVMGVVVSNLLTTDVNFAILVTQSIPLAVAMYIIFYGAPSIFAKLRQWINTPKIKNLKLEKKSLENGNLAFLLFKKEFRKPAI